MHKFLYSTLPLNSILRLSNVVRCWCTGTGSGLVNMSEIFGWGAVENLNLIWDYLLSYKMMLYIDMFAACMKPWVVLQRLGSKPAHEWAEPCFSHAEPGTWLVALVSLNCTVPGSSRLSHWATFPFLATYPRMPLLAHQPLIIPLPVYVFLSFSPLYLSSHQIYLITQESPRWLASKPSGILGTGTVISSLRSQQRWNFTHAARLFWHNFLQGR